jgi:hypothetical protein
MAFSHTTTARADFLTAFRNKSQRGDDDAEGCITFPRPVTYPGAALTPVLAAFRLGYCEIYIARRRRVHV